MLTRKFIINRLERVFLWEEKKIASQNLWMCSREKNQCIETWFEENWHDAILWIFIFIALKNDNIFCATGLFSGIQTNRILIGYTSDCYHSNDQFIFAI